MYGSSTAGDGRLVRHWMTPDGACAASVILADGRSYVLYGCFGDSVRGMSAREVERTKETLRREVAKQVEHVLAWDDAAS